MAMYYYASKLSEASCSGCNIKVPSTTTQQASVSTAQNDHAAQLPSEETILHGSGLSYYDNDDYYSMIRGNSCKHIVMNGGINLIATQKLEASQLSAVIAPGVKSVASLPYINCSTEKPDIEYKEGQIVSGTLDALVDMLRPGANKSFTFTFLLCSRLFMKPHELLSKLCKRYFKNYDKNGKGDVKDLVEKELNDMIALVRVLSQWTAMFPYDFRDERVMALVRSITQRCATEHMASVRIEMSTTLERLLRKLTALEQYEESLTQVPPVSSMDQLAKGDILTLGLTPLELANQLTIVELHKLSFVGPEEFVQTFAPAQSQQSTSTCAMGSISLHHVEAKTTRNLEAYADWFNRLSYLVATDILKAIKSKVRARIIEQWVMTARECFNLGNFNSLMAIISALNMAPISRLKKTWSRTSPVCGQQLRQLELCVEPTGNHARYRAALAAAPTETAVPLLTVTCRDLHFANQGSPSKLSSNRVNFEKCSLLGRHVSTQLAGRRLTTDEGPAHALPAPHLAVWRYLNNRPTLTEFAVIAPGVKSVASLPYINCSTEKPDIEYKEGQIVSGTLDALVDMLRPGANKSFTFTFLLCSRLFMKPHELLSKLCKRYFKNYDKNGKGDVKDLVEKELNDMIALVRVLSQWTAMFPYDFRDERVMALVRSITQRCATEHMASVRIEMSTTLERLLRKLTALEQYEESLTQVPPVSSMDQLAKGDILTLGLTPLELANQLTIVELHKLSFVGPEEFVQTFAPAQSQQSTSTCAMGSISLHHVEAKTTRNLEAYADWFNRLSYLVATDILKAIKSKVRARIIEQWVMTARECFNLGNFNSLMAIISALNMAPISRLKKTWSRTSPVCGQQLRQLELCVEPTGNHARYRAALAAAPTETAVPLLTVTCRDLHFANQGSPSKLSSNRVNFEKCSLLGRHVSTQLAGRRLTTDEGPAHALPAPHLAVWRYLNNRPTLTEFALEVASFEREPPVDQLEKERLKRLRGTS